MRSVAMIVSTTASLSFAARHLFILAGQSNMAGDPTWIGELPPDSIPNVKFWNGFGAYAGAWVALRPGMSSDAGRFGPEMTLASTLVAALPNDTFAMIKVAYPGTAMVDKWRPPSRGGPGVCYKSLVDNVALTHGVTAVWKTVQVDTSGKGTTIPVTTVIDSAARKIQIAGKTYPFEGFFLMQGESDGTADTSAQQYYDNFKAFVRDLRTTWGDSTTPWVVGLVDRQPAAWPFVDLIRSAQQKVGEEHRHIGLVETIGIPTNGLHYTADGQKEFGKRLAAKWLEMTGRNNPPTSTARAPVAALAGGILDPQARVREVDSQGRSGPWLPAREWMALSRRGPSSRGLAVLEVVDFDTRHRFVKLPPLLQ